MFGQPSSFAALTVESTAEDCSPKIVIRDYLIKHEPVFARLKELREKVLFPIVLRFHHGEMMIVRSGLGTKRG